MSNPEPEKQESKADRTDRIAREIISADRSSRDRKTERLREMRLKAERMAGA